MYKKIPQNLDRPSARGGGGGGEVTVARERGAHDNGRLQTKHNINHIKINISINYNTDTAAGQQSTQGAKPLK